MISLADNETNTVTPRHHDILEAAYGNLKGRHRTACATARQAFEARNRAVIAWLLRRLSELEDAKYAAVRIRHDADFSDWYLERRH